MNVAVTGGAGQLGTLVVRRLCADRAVKQVVCIDLRPPAVACGKMRAVRCDVRDPAIAAHFAGCDVVVHLAAIVSGNPPRAIFEAINVEGSKNVVTAAANAGAKQVVYLSSIAAYGVLPGHPVPIVEDTPRRFQPEFAYSATKHSVEAFLDAFEPEHPDLAVARLRPAILIGSHMEHPLGDMLRRGVLVEGASAPLPIVWDEDVADAVLRAVRQRARGAFNLAADEPLPVAELARAGGLRTVRIPRALLGALTRVGSLLARVGLGRSFDPAWAVDRGAVMIVSSEKARRELGWKPRCPTAADVIRRYVEVAPRGKNFRLAAFFRAADLGSRFAPVPPEARPVSALIHLALAGPGGGDWTLAIRTGRASLKRGIPRPPGAVIMTRATTFQDLLAGRADLTTACMSGAVRIEGEPAAAMILQSLISQARSRLPRFLFKGAPT